MRRVWLIGAGYISHVHAEALRSVPRVRLHGIVDPNLEVARSAAKQWGIARVMASVDEAIASGEVDCSHILTPPHLHAQTALPFLRAKIPTLLEKPIAVTENECHALISEARRNDVAIGVNQNFVFHPAFQKLRQCIAERRLGKPNFINVIYNSPLRQLTTGQFGHWMFRAPRNILLEQAVHPLSQLVSLSGKIRDIEAIAPRPTEISPGVPFYPELTLTMRTDSLPCSMRFAVGETYPFWQLSVVCDDGVALADMTQNRFVVLKRGPGMDAYDQLRSAGEIAFATLGASIANAANFTFSTVRLKSRSDPFFRSMRKAISAFHQALDDSRTPELDGEFGAHLVHVCDEVARKSFTVKPAPLAPKTSGNYDIVVLGGTGFIGTHLVHRLIAHGQRIAVMARNTCNLPAEFYHENVVLIAGDVRRAADVERAIGRATTVINLAHGGGGKSFSEIQSAMVGSAEMIAKACLSLGVRRLIHVGSIASLYLGPQRRRVTGTTLPDPKAGFRSDYARAKAECDRMLFEMHRSHGLPVCILRPGLVIGERGIPLHGGLGFYNNEQHCIGWNAGHNPLPFVLVEDVAESIRLACEAPDVIGHAYNIIGDVKMSAREYLLELSSAMSRPLQFHPKRPLLLWLQEMSKWAVKRSTGRSVARPSLRDVLSRGLTAEFDCEDAKRDLGWTPVSDRQVFIERGIRVSGHA